MQEFHRYPTEDRLAARQQARRLAALESKVAALCAPFVEAHRVALALSFGKDSMTVLHIVHSAGLLDKCAVVMWNNSGMETTDTLAFRDYVVKRYALRNYVETCPDPEMLERTLRAIDFDSPHPTRDFVYECLELPRWHVMNEHGIDGTILGLRAEESRARRANIGVRGTQYWNRREKANILLPLAYWSGRDVLLHAALRNVPLHPVYARMPTLGFDRDRVRLNTPVSVCMRDHGQLAALRKLYPATFARYAGLVPAIRQFT